MWACTGELVSSYMSEVITQASSVIRKSFVWFAHADASVFFHQCISPKNSCSLLHFTTLNIHLLSCNWTFWLALSSLHSWRTCSLSSVHSYKKSSFEGGVAYIYIYIHINTHILGCCSNTFLAGLRRRLCAVIFVILHCLVCCYVCSRVLLFVL